MGNNLVSTITLCHVPITPTNQLDFADVQKQIDYFRSKAIATYDKCKYIPRDGSIIIKGYVDDFTNCNYGFYVNSHGTTAKYYYFWILEKNQISRNSFELTIAIDVFQTWYWYFNMRPCFIERETVSDDTIGLHTLPEDLEFGNYIAYDSKKVNDLTDNLCYMLAVCTGNSGGKFGALYEGYELYYFDSADITALDNKIQSICDAGQADSIAYIFSYPKNIVQKIKSGISSGDRISECSFYSEENVTFKMRGVPTFKYPVSAITETYTAFNNKLLCYPYDFLTISNAEGGNVILKRELNKNGGEFTFQLDGVLTQNPQFSLTPVNYGANKNMYVNSITSGGFGLCSWNNDNYANWYANNSHSINAQSANAKASYKTSARIAGNNYNNAMFNASQSALKGTISAIGALGGIISTNPLGALGNAVGTGVNTAIDYTTAKSTAKNDLQNTTLLNDTDYGNTIRSLMAMVSDAQVQPNTCKGDTSASGLDLARHSNTFVIEETSITPEYAQAIDMYFQHYGYLVNTTRKPQLHSRKRWNYIKTVGCNIDSQKIPKNDADAINALFDNGITIWHDERYMFNYNVKNDCTGLTDSDKGDIIIGELGNLDNSDNEENNSHL